MLHGVRIWPTCLVDIFFSQLNCYDVFTMYFCSPGRFFAVNELKALMGHVIMNYEVKFAQDRKGCPAPVWFSSVAAPDDTVELMLRKRPTV
jgi:hypothetical protein